MTVTIDEIEHAFALQFDWCTHNGSPFTGALLEVAHDNIKAKGRVHDLVTGWPRHPVDDALALRFAGALHALVSSNKAPDLAALYPANTSTIDKAALAQAMAPVLDEHYDFIADYLTRPVQTNEIGRSAALMPGFLELGKHTNQPLHLAEIGASAGLNLLWDQFHYDFGAGQKWGDPASPITLTPNWKGPLPNLAAQPMVLSRAGVDINPLDLSTDEAVTAASAYIWPDQFDRLARFKAAAQMVRDHGIVVEKADAGDWVDAQLAGRPKDAAFVIYHSVMWQYMPAETQDRIESAILASAETATKEAPLAWLAFEPEEGIGLPELRLRFWDGATTVNERLAWCHPHGTDIEWLAA